MYTRELWESCSVCVKISGCKVIDTPYNLADGCLLATTKFVPDETSYSVLCADGQFHDVIGMERFDSDVVEFKTSDKSIRVPVNQRIYASTVVTKKEHKECTEYRALLLNSLQQDSQVFLPKARSYHMEAQMSDMVKGWIFGVMKEVRR